MGVRIMESGRGRKGPLEGKTPGYDRDLGAGQELQREGNRMREGSHRLAQETSWGKRHGREAQTIGGGRRVGAPSRCTVPPRLGDMGGGRSG